MAQKKYLDSNGLSKLIGNIANVFSKKGHTHTKSQITDFAHNHDERYYTESEIDSKLSKKADSSHTHTKSQITDFPTSMPASDVSAWAKAASKPTYTKSEVGLGNVDNTADANKSVKYAVSAGSASKATTTTGVANSGTATSDVARHVWFSDDTTETKRVSNDDFKYNPSGNLLTANITGNAATASSIAWGNVSGKPTTYAPSAHTHDDRYYTESEVNSKLAGKAASSHKHTAADITSVNASAITGTIPAANLPSFVDDVIEGYYSGSKFYKTKNSDGTYATEIAGEAGKIYVNLNDNKTYRWAGSAYVVISETLAVGETSSTAYRGDRGKVAYDHSQKTGNPHGTTKSDLGLGNVENKSSATIRGELTKTNVTTALGYTPPTINTTYPVGTPTVTGTTKLYTSTGDAVDGTMTQSAITTALNGKAASSHTHSYAGSSSAGGAANSATKLTTARKLKVSLSAADAQSFDGSADAQSIGVSGTLAISNGGTGTTSANGIRTNIGVNPVTTGGTGAAYTASVNGIISLAVGASFVMIPHTASTTTAPTLNVNGLGAKNIRLRLSSAPQATIALIKSNFLVANRPIKVTYDGTQWIIDDMVQPEVNNLYGTVPISKGGTGATTAAKARQNLGITTSNGTMLSQNADYAEVGEWADGNLADEDRIGYFVTIDDTTAGTTMVKAKSTSDVRGVTVTAPAFSGNCSDDKYNSNGNLLKQYDYVAVMGVVSVIDNGKCTVNGRCMPNDSGTAVPSPNNMGYQVIDRIDSTHVLIAVEPEADMMVRIKSDVGELQKQLPVFTYGTDVPTSDTNGCFYIQVI